MAQESENLGRGEARGGQRTPGRRGFGVIVALLAVLALGGLVWLKAIKPNLTLDNFGVVTEGAVYRSADLTPAATKLATETYHIKTIIDLGAYDKRPELEKVAQKTADALGIERHVFRLEGDGSGNPNAYVEALRIMTDPSKQPVLVHCSAGAQRTSACVMLYRHIVEGQTFRSVVHEAWEHRHDPGRNRVMLPWLLDWHEQIERAFHTGTWIEGQPEPMPPGLGTPGRSVDRSARENP